ncbi:corticotropin-releasing diuretic hormone 44 isoform X2 [Leptinotarsa decemlineata]
MRAPLFVLCAALVVAIRSEDTSAVNTNFFNRQLEPINMAADQETISYLLPKLAAKYRPNSDWAGVTDPRFYLLTEMESNDFDNQVANNRRIRNKRYDFDVYEPRQVRYDFGEEPSLSINANIQNLRQAYAKTKLRERLAANRKFLENLRDSQ